MEDWEKRARERAAALVDNGLVNQSLHEFRVHLEAAHYAKVLKYRQMSALDMAIEGINLVPGNPLANRLIPVLAVRFYVSVFTIRSADLRFDPYKPGWHAQLYILDGHVPSIEGYVNQGLLLSAVEGA